MIRTRLFAFTGLAVAFLFVVQRSIADTYPVILTGTVTLEDGTPPPFTVSIERSCSDSLGGTPGPLTDKKGKWIWRLEIDAFASRACVFKAIHPGYISTGVDASNLNVTSHATTLTVAPIVLLEATADPYAIRFSDDAIPFKARGNVSKALKAMDDRQYDVTQSELTAAVAAAPKFSAGWHALGVVDENLQKPAEARDAYTHAIAADPKLLPPYVTLTRLCIKTKDWECAAKTADSLIKLDTKRTYPEIYMHRAVAEYQLKDLPAAEQSINEALRLDPKRKRPRAEYVLGRILEAKGDATAAKEHFSKYVTLDPNAPDLEMVKAHLESVGKPDATEPDLEHL